MAHGRTQIVALLKKDGALCNKSFEELDLLLKTGWEIINGTEISQKEHDRPHGGVLYILRREIEV